MCLIYAVRRQKQAEFYELKVSLVYTVSGQLGLIATPGPRKISICHVSSLIFVSYVRIVNWEYVKLGITARARKVKWGNGAKGTTEKEITG